MTNRKLFQIIIEETVSESFDVYADSIEEAIQTAEDKYNNSEFVLSPGNITDRKIAAFDKDMNLEQEWIEF